MADYDFIIIGGGIIGLTTSYCLLDNKVLVLEKEKDICLHQTGRNSGVVHSGIYYKPNSSKSENCKLGKRLLEIFCEDNNVPIKKCGKVIVATEKKEEESLEKLYQNGKDQEIDCELITREKLLELEPYVTNAISALHVKDTSVIDYKSVCRKLQEGTNVKFNEKVVSYVSNKNHVCVYTENNFYTCKHLINCSGVHSDELLKNNQMKIIPFKGTYYKLSDNASKYCNNLIYPVSDPQFPFLGIHFHRKIDNEVECGPNASLAFGKEAYGKYDFNLKEVFDMVKFPGFRRLLMNNWRFVLSELKSSLFKYEFLRQSKKLIPCLKAKDLISSSCGIRSQLVSENGKLIDDFTLLEEGNVFHVLNAPSPAATSAFAIAEKIARYFI